MTVNSYNSDNRKFVYVFPSVHGTVNVVNYDAGNAHLNTFLWCFDIWNCNGHFKMSGDGKHQEVWFECTKQFMELCQTGEFLRAFQRMGVKVVFEYPFEDI